MMANGLGSDPPSFGIAPRQLAEEIVRKKSNGAKSNGHDPDAGWPDPEPLIEPGEEEWPYPVDALPPIISAAYCRPFLASSPASANSRFTRNSSHRKWRAR